MHLWMQPGVRNTQPWIPMETIAEKPRTHTLIRISFIYIPILPEWLKPYSYCCAQGPGVVRDLPAPKVVVDPGIGKLAAYEDHSSEGHERKSTAH